METYITYVGKTIQKKNSFKYTIKFMTENIFKNSLFLNLLSI